MSSVLPDNCQLTLNFQSPSSQPPAEIGRTSVFLFAHFTDLETNSWPRVSDVSRTSKWQNRDFELNSSDLWFATLIKYMEMGMP